MTTMRFDRKTLSNTLWVTKTTVKRSSCHSSQQVVVELEAGDLVERGEGLVHQQQRGLVTRPRAIETRIFMPPESSRGIGVLEAGRGATRSSNSVDRRRRLGARDAAQPQRQPDIVEDVGPGQQRRLLEDEADSQRSPSRLPRQSSSAGGRRRQAGDQPQRRRLAAARRAEQAEEIALAGSSGRRCAAR